MSLEDCIVFVQQMQTQNKSKSDVRCACACEWMCATNVFLTLEKGECSVKIIELMVISEGCYKNLFERWRHFRILSFASFPPFAFEGASFFA